MRPRWVSAATARVGLIGLACAVWSGSAGCFSWRESQGGGEETPAAGRRVEAADVAVYAGYTIEVAASGLTFPTGIAFDDAGTAHVTESGYSYGEMFTRPRLLALGPNGPREIAAGGEREGPWNGVAWGDGAFFIADGGTMGGGRILRVSPDGKMTALVSDLPSRGDHHTNGPVLHDGWVYFGQGTATNAGVVGPENASFGWLRRFPDFHDIPCRDVTLSGASFDSDNPLEPGKTARTGAYLPFGTAAEPGQVVPGKVPCTGAILRVPVRGGATEMVAWGFRNPFGLMVTPDGKLYATDNGYDVRGSRGVFGAPDLLWQVQPGGWYGWPDFVGERRVDDDFFQPPDAPAPQLVLASHPGTPGRPIAKLAVHSSSNGLDVSRSERFGFVGEVFIAQFGDQAPAVGKVWSPVGFKVVKVDLHSGDIVDFAVNRGKTNGPASKLGQGGLERPLAARFSRDGQALYVVDFGVLRMDDGGRAHPQPGTGVVWKISRREGR
jgi:hypothetical protein